MAVLWNNASKPRGGKILLQDLYNAIKILKWKLIYDITKLTAELKSDKLMYSTMYRNKIYYHVACFRQLT